MTLFDYIRCDGSIGSDITEGDTLRMVLDGGQRHGGFVDHLLGPAHDDIMRFCLGHKGNCWSLNLVDEEDGVVLVVELLEGDTGGHRGGAGDRNLAVVAQGDRCGTSEGTLNLNPVVAVGRNRNHHAVAALNAHDGQANRVVIWSTSTDSLVVGHVLAIHGDGITIKNSISVIAEEMDAAATITNSSNGKLRIGKEFGTKGHTLVSDRECTLEVVVRIYCHVQRVTTLGGAPTIEVMVYGRHCHDGDSHIVIMGFEGEYLGIIGGEETLRQGTAVGNSELTDTQRGSRTRDDQIVGIEAADSAPAAGGINVDGAVWGETHQVGLIDVGGNVEADTSDIVIAIRSDSDGFALLNLHAIGGGGFAGCHGDDAGSIGSHIMVFIVRRGTGQIGERGVITRQYKLHMSISTIDKRQRWIVGKISDITVLFGNSEAVGGVGAHLYPTLRPIHEVVARVGCSLQSTGGEVVVAASTGNVAGGSRVDRSSDSVIVDGPVTGDAYVVVGHRGHLACPAMEGVTLHGRHRGGGHRSGVVICNRGRHFGSTGRNCSRVGVGHRMAIDGPIARHINVVVGHRRHFARPATEGVAL